MARRMYRHMFAKLLVGESIQGKFSWKKKTPEVRYTSDFTKTPPEFIKTRRKTPQLSYS